MSVLATVFPIPLKHLSKRITYRTDITVGRSGNEVRNALWQDPIYTFDIGAVIETRANAELLEAFFHSCKGREKGFLIQDLLDYAIPPSGSTPQSIGTGNGSQTVFPIYKTYTDALSNTYQRYITRPFATGVEVYKAGVLQNSGYTLSTTAGTITFSVAPGGGQAITVVVPKFYLPVRFDTDELPIDLIIHTIEGATVKTISEMPSVPLIEIRE